MQTTLICPHCKKPIEIEEALSHQVEEKILKEQQEKYEKELSEMKKKVQTAENAEIEFRKKVNQFEEDKRKFELESQRQLDREREAIRKKTLEEADESHRLKEREKDKVIDDLKKAVEEANRKASLGSQQLQGEVQELDLEQTLLASFSDDIIEPIGKGVLGADVRQTVRSKRGHPCGKILWESKRTKAWSDGWISKLKEDLRNDKSDIPIIVSTALPEEAKSGFGFKDGVYIVSPVLIIPIAESFRQRLIDLARERFISQRSDEKASVLYGYITSPEFRQHLEAIAEVYGEMREQITKERAAFERIWKTREMQLEKISRNTSRIVGSMQGIVGSALPPLKYFELPDGSETE